MDYGNTLTKIFQRKPEEIDESVVDELLLYSEYLQQTDVEFHQIAEEKIGDPTITWSRPWYQMTKIVQKETFTLRDVQDHHDTFKFNKPWISDESELILKNWNKLRKKYDLPDTPASLFRCKTGKSNAGNSWIPFRLFMVAYIGRGLQRTLYQVYKRSIVEFIHGDTYTYTATEKKIVEIFLEHCQSVRSPVQELHRILGRPVRQLYQILEDKRNGKVITTPSKWTLVRATKFFRALIKASQIPFEKLKDVQIKGQVWRYLGEKFTTNYINLKKFWYTKLHVMLFVKEDIHFRKLLKKLFKILKKSQYKRWSDIDWKEMTKHFPEGCTWLFLYYSAVRLFDKSLAQKFFTVPEVADMVLQERLPHIPKRRLKRVVFVNNKLEYLRKEDREKEKENYEENYKE